MKTAILPLVVIIAASCAFGQQTPTPAVSQSAWSTQPLRIGPAVCPVDLEAEHVGTLGQSRADYAVHGDVLPSSPNQRIRLTMTNLLPQDVVSAEITAHGFSRKGRSIPLAGASATPDLTKTVSLAMPLKGSSRVSQELSLDRFTSVAVIDIDSVTYADGSTWHASSARACSVTPSLLMRITASLK